jgi:hypothetical protein
MIMTSRFTLGAAVAGLIWAGCSSPAEDDPGPPTSPPPLSLPGFGQGGTTAAPINPAPAPAAQGGSTGQTGVVPAGMGGSAVAVGAGGAPAGVGGAPASTIPTGMGRLIMHDVEGWVAGATNAVGIQGSFYTISDTTGTPPGVTMIQLGDFATSPTSTCVRGTASAVPDATGYSQFWGGGLALNLADPGGMVGAGPWTPGTVTGFSFTVTGPTIPAALRFNATGAAGTFCGNLAAGANSVSLTSLHLTCYNPVPGAAFTAGTALESIQWQVVTVLGESTPFDFCIENLTAL